MATIAEQIEEGVKLILAAAYDEAVSVECVITTVKVIVDGWADWSRENTTIVKDPNGSVPQAVFGALPQLLEAHDVGMTVNFDLHNFISESLDEHGWTVRNARHVLVALAGICDAVVHDHGYKPRYPLEQHVAMNVLNYLRQSSVTLRWAAASPLTFITEPIEDSTVLTLRRLKAEKKARERALNGNAAGNNGANNTSGIGMPAFGNVPVAPSQEQVKQVPEIGKSSSLCRSQSLFQHVLIPSQKPTPSTS